jgi:hypothetical protein
MPRLRASPAGRTGVVYAVSAMFQVEAGILIMPCRKDRDWYHNEDGNVPPRRRIQQLPLPSTAGALCRSSFSQQ